MDLDNELLKSEAELLELQINPHYIFNVLNSIKSLIISSKANALKAISLLESSLFNGYSKKGFGLIALDAELEIVKSYSEIEIIRHGKSLSFDFRVEDNLNQILIPAGMLLVLVENAVKHGRRKSGETNKIVITVSRRNNEVLFTVENSGQLRECKNGIIEEPKKTGIGLLNLTKRLSLYFPKNHKICWRNINTENIAVTIGLNIK